MTTAPQPRPRCFYCDSILTDDEARIALPSGRVFGACCEDLEHLDASKDS